jgi:membrane-bound metal-dependent hydrolase YbcI (DUF457 family)
VPLAVTHILSAIILVELFRDFIVKDNKKFPRYYILIAAIGGILPDFDYAFVYLLSSLNISFNQIHQTYSHTIFVPIFLSLVALAIYYTGTKSKLLGKHHIKLTTAFVILSLGSLLHILLDVTFYEKIRIFYPLSEYYVGLNLVGLVPEKLRSLTLPVLDGILLMCWILWMEFRLKISNYF